MCRAVISSRSVRSGGGHVERADQLVAQAGEFGDAALLGDHDAAGNRRTPAARSRRRIASAIVADGEMPTASWIVAGSSARPALPARPGKTWIARPSASPRMATATARQISAPSADRLPWTSSPFQSSAALDGAAVQMMRGVGSPPAFAPAPRRRAQSTSSDEQCAQQARHGRSLRRYLVASEVTKKDGSPRLPSLRPAYPTGAADAIKASRCPRSACPGDVVGRGLTSIGYGSIGCPFVVGLGREVGRQDADRLAGAVGVAVGRVGFACQVRQRVDLLRS